MCRFWSGDIIDKLKPNQIFVFGSNPEGRHGKGSAKAALAFGAIMGQGRGLQGQTYALVTKNLKAGFVEKSTGITYFKEGLRSVSTLQIKDNVDEMYECARANPDLEFLIPYKHVNEDGSQVNNLNGYLPDEIMTFFVRPDIPENISFHISFKDLLKLKSDELMSKPENRGYFFFYDTRSPFSNFYPSLFTFKGRQFISAEQFIMYCKAQIFGDSAMAEKIMGYSEHPVAKRFIDGSWTPDRLQDNLSDRRNWIDLMMFIKNSGRKVSNYDDAVWASKRTGVGYKAAYEKFTQNPELLEELLSKGDMIMVEAAPNDLIWGIGLDEVAAKKVPPSAWKGQNILGNLLTKLKDDLRQTS